LAHGGDLSMPILARCSIDSAGPCCYNTPMIPTKVPLRIDLAGGWLDVPRHARKGAFVVNLAIQPLIGLDDSFYQRGAGLGGSAAHAILQGLDPFASEDAMGVGWQDPAVILETGLCVWRSGPRPVLEQKRNPDFLDGLLALHWTGQTHDTPSNADRPRNYEWIEEAGHEAAVGVSQRSYRRILNSVRMSYWAQRHEFMAELPPSHEALAWKYCGGGWGGYAVYLYPTRELRDASGLIRVEPYMRQPGE